MGRVKELSPIPAVPPEKLKLNEMLRGIAGGDRSIFGSFYDEMAPLVFGLAKRILRAPALAEEVTQEVFLEIWQKAGDWAPERSSAPAWVLMIARRRAIDRVRSEQASRDRQETVGPAMSYHPGSEPHEAAELEAERAAVRSAISGLSDNQQVVIDLAYYQGKTYQEVAEMLDIPVGTVKTRMRDALIRMRAHYGVSQ